MGSRCQVFLRSPGTFNSKLKLSDPSPDASPTTKIIRPPKDDRVGSVRFFFRFFSIVRSTGFRWGYDDLIKIAIISIILIIPIIP